MKEKPDWICECGHKRKEHKLAPGIDWFCEGITFGKHSYCECPCFSLDNFWFVKIYGKKAKKKC
jgi:hypothetical protein